MQEDTVTILIKSDRPGEIHLEGYDKEMNLLPNGDVALTFLAENAGLFPIHIHETAGERHVATLVVQPR